MAAKSRIETELAESDLAEFRRLLATGRLTIDGLTLWLEGRGYEISRSAVGRYAKSFDQVAGRLRESRQITEALVAELGDAAAQGKQGRLLVEMARSVVFDLLMKLQAEDAAVDTKDVQQLGKGLAELGKALRYDQDFELKIREAATRETKEAAADAVARVAKSAGLTKDTLEQLRAGIFGVDG